MTTPHSSHTGIMASRKYFQLARSCSASMASYCFRVVSSRARRSGSQPGRVKPWESSAVRRTISRGVMPCSSASSKYRLLLPSSGITRARSVRSQSNTGMKLYTITFTPYSARLRMVSI